MAAVIGSRDNFNRNPKKMGRFYNSASGGGLCVPSANTPIFNMNNAFNTTNLWTTVTTASSIVANQSYTIYNVSGASGFLIHAFTNCTDNAANNVTFTVTVDGVVSSIPFGASSGGGYMCGWLGRTAGSRMDTENLRKYATNTNGQVGGTEFPSGAMLSTGGAIASPLNLNSKVIDYATGNGSLRGILYAQDLSAPISNPLSCTRFETSLTVAYSTTVAIASSAAATRRFYGALVKLDD